MRRRWLRKAVANSAAAIAGAALSACGGAEPGPAASVARHLERPAWLDRLRERLGLLSREPDWQRIAGGFVGADLERGHRLRDAATAASQTTAAHSRAVPAVPARSTRVAIIGAGVAGLAAARRLAAAGIDQYRIFELDAEIGGNSRGGTLGGLRCPWGAHYLPSPSLTPGNRFEQELLAMLREFGLVHDGPAGPRFLETALCQAPQERLLVKDRWQTGLLPSEGVSRSGLSQYRKFSELVAREKSTGGFELPASLPSKSQASRDQISFDRWLDEHGLVDPHLRWYLDYCCRDDYGAGVGEVSAWAGLHYFASRHGFEYNDEPSAGSRTESASEVLTWPQGNEWLLQKMAGPHRPRIHVDAAVQHIRVVPGNRSGAAIDIWHAREQRVESWQAEFVILAIPLNVAARLLDPLPQALRSLLPKLRYAGWQVSNVLLSRSPAELPGAPLSWDNVVYGSEWLGYVDAGHQLLQGHRSGALFTSYRALGGERDKSRHILSRPWREQVTEVLDFFRPIYPDINRLVQAVDIVRWGHAMLLPAPGLRSDPAFATLRELGGPVVLAHSDLAGYSVFEEAFAAGLAAADKVARHLSR